MRLRQNSGWAVTHEDKENLIFDHFSQSLGRPPPRQLDFNWEALNLTAHLLENLGFPFNGAEIKEALDDMPTDKAPGPEGFSIAFFRSSGRLSRATL
jgi:hypothetical protein